MKTLAYAGDAEKRLRGFPANALRDAGRQLRRVQLGQEPNDWKPMPSIGKGVREIRIWDEAGAFRVIYLAKLADQIVVLHAFRKTTQATSRKDVELARKRLRQLTGV